MLTSLTVCGEPQWGKEEVLIQATASVLLTVLVSILTSSELVSFYVYWIKSEEGISTASIRLSCRQPRRAF